MDIYLQTDCQTILNAYSQHPTAAMSFAEILRRISDNSHSSQNDMFAALHELLVIGKMRMIYTLDLTILFELVEDEEDTDVSNSIHHEWAELPSLSIPSVAINVPPNPIATNAILHHLLESIYDLLEPILPEEKMDAVVDNLNKIFRLGINI